MSACCSDSVCSSTSSAIPPRYRRVLWIALVANLAMFGVEIVAGWNANSVSLLAGAVDFFGDAANYGLSLAVLSMAVVWRSRAALVKGLSMGAYGIYVLGQAGWNAFAGILPEAMTMGVVGAMGRMPAKRSEEHTSELQSLMRISYAVFCLKKKNKKRQPSQK